MKTCPKCGELVGNSVSSCFKCKHSFGMTASGSSGTNRRRCPDCGLVYYYPQKTCPTCKTSLNPYHSTMGSRNTYQNQRDDSMDVPPTWQYVVGILFPIVGIILGIVYLTQKRESAGLMLILSLIASVVLPFVYYFITYAILWNMLF